MKGSQLSQLKSALSKAGITGQQPNGKKRKRSASRDKDKDKKAAKLDEIQQKLNPFDVKVTKLKHDVGGRKLKGVVGRPARSKQAGIEQRKKTLLKEFEERDRAGGIVDRRFGENDPSMSLEERMLERFTKERQRASKGAVYNLEDEDELTHYGQSLSKLDDFDDVGLGLDDEEEDERGQIDSEVVKRTHFGGFSDDERDAEDEQPDRKKSKAEVMAEVMAKSKEHKLRRQMEREHEDSIRHELDQEFDSLRHLIYAPDPSLTGSNTVPLGRDRPEVAPLEGVTAPVIPKNDDDYDQRVRELAFDKRAKAKDRTKTEEELALEEKLALEKAERKRRKRMMGEDESESEAEAGEKKRGKRKRGGDDLEDDFESEGEEWGGLGMGLGSGPKTEPSEDGGDDRGEDGSKDSDGGDDGPGDGDELDDDPTSGSGSDESSDGEEWEHENLVAVANTAGHQTKSKQATGKENKELPYTFPCPSTHDEFLEIIDGIHDEDVPTVVQRIRALYHPSLSPENKSKLQALTTVLIDHVLYITSPPSPPYSLLSSLLSPLYSLIRSYPISSAQHFNKKLLLMHKNLKHGLSRGALDLEAKTWPGMAELSLLRIIGTVWPTSDMNHAVITPTRLLMAAYLGLGRVRSLGDIASGLFLCTLFLQFERLSKRLVPEAVIFVVNSVLYLAPHDYEDAWSLPGSFASPDFRSDLCRPLSVDPKHAKKVVYQKPTLADMLSADSKNEPAKISLLGLAFDLLGRFADLYKGVEAFIELFEPIHSILRNLNIKSLPQELQTRVTTLIDTAGRLLKFAQQSRKPLLLQAHKPIPIPSYIPKFETTSSSYLRRQDPDHERNEASKLRNQYKQERKGAIRELRKDSRFLAGVEQAKQREKDRAYNDRMKRVFGSIEGERAEEKAMEREKSKEKRRSGRK